MNERWADHWVDLFAERGFRVIDVVRPALWDDQTVEAWYVQNTFVFANADALARSASLAEAADRGLAFPLRVVHPRLLEYVAAQPELTIRAQPPADASGGADHDQQPIVCAARARAAR